jgi:hypothetical protein
MKKTDQFEFGIRCETGELYLLNREERALTIEVLKMALTTERGREFLLERFGEEGLEMALSLLREMGVKSTRHKGQKPRTPSFFAAV